MIEGEKHFRSSENQQVSVLLLTRAQIPGHTQQDLEFSVGFCALRSPYTDPPENHYNSYFPSLFSQWAVDGRCRIVSISHCNFW